jgi:hypothetical protein
MFEQTGNADKIRRAAILRSFECRQPQAEAPADDPTYRWEGGAPHMPMQTVDLLRGMVEAAKLGLY